MGFKNETHLFLQSLSPGNKFWLPAGDLFLGYGCVLVPPNPSSFQIYSCGFLRDVEKNFNFFPLGACIFKKL
jgi:hypothetical protein